MSLPVLVWSISLRKVSACTASPARTNSSGRLNTTGECCSACTASDCFTAMLTIVFGLASGQ